MVPLWVCCTSAPFLQAPYPSPELFTPEDCLGQYRLLVSSAKTPCVRAGGSLHTPSLPLIHLQAILRTLREGQILTSVFALIWWRFSSGICPIDLLLFRKDSLRVTCLHTGKYHFVGLVVICHWHTLGAKSINAHKCQGLEFLSQRQTCLESDLLPHFNTHSPKQMVI